jgi:SAM-dependent methyltransferase
VDATEREQILCALTLLLTMGGCSRTSPAPTPAPSASAAAVAPVRVHTRDRTHLRRPDLLPEDGGDDVRDWCADHDHPCVVYVPTPQKVVDKMLQVAKLQSTDVLYDLGCGDGRILVTAAKKYGVHAFGFDINPDRVNEARQNARLAGVEELVSIEQQDVFTVDLTPATVVTVYLLPRLNLRLAPQLAKLAHGTRIVSHDFDIEGTLHDGKWTMMASFFGYKNELYDASAPEDWAHYKQVEHKVYLWVAPVRWASGWDGALRELGQ